MLRKDYQLDLQEEICNKDRWTARSRALTSKSKSVIPCNPPQSTIGNVFRKKAWKFPQPEILFAISKWKSENVRRPPKRQAHTKKVQLVHMKIKGQQKYEFKRCKNLVIANCMNIEQSRKSSSYDIHYFHCR